MSLEHVDRCPVDGCDRRGAGAALMSSIAAGCPVDYPTDPIDGYELTWWSVQYHSDVEVLRHRSVYVAKATWDDAVPEHERRTSGPGAPFEDEWKVYWRGQFTGRNPGWNCYRESSRFDWRGSYATEREALDAAIMLARDELGAAEDRVRVIKSSLEALVQRRATLPISTEGNVNDAAARHGRGREVRPASECLSPGCCTCPEMKKCPGCGYTAHDRAWLTDHRFCRYANQAQVQTGIGEEGERGR